MKDDAIQKLEDEIAHLKDIYEHALQVNFTTTISLILPNNTREKEKRESPMTWCHVVLNN